MINYKELSDTELFDLYRNKNDIDARNEIFERYVYIARIVAGKFAGRGIEYDDIIQTASLALVKAIDRFDVNRNVQFNTFVTPSIIGEVKNYFRDTLKTIRVPRADAMLVKRMNDEIAIFQSEYGEMPTVGYLSEKLGVKTEKIIELLELKKATTVLSLDAPVSDDEKVDVLETLGAEEKGFGRIENQDFYQSCLAVLDKDEKILVEERFFHNRTQADIAKKLGVSQMQVSRMERRILNKLKTYF